MILPVIDAENVKCPFMNGQPCAGCKCAAWRFTDVRRNYGYCGVAGIPLLVKVGND